MKLAIIGSRGITLNDIEKYLPQEIDAFDEIVSGGAKGVDTAAAKFAKENGIVLTEFLPDYKLYGRGAPLKQIAEYADEALAFWDGASRGTAYSIELFKKLSKKVTVIIIQQNKE